MTSCIRRAFRTFAKDNCGAVSVDWVTITVAVAFVAAGLIFMISQSAETAMGGVAARMGEVIDAAEQ